MRNKLIFLVSIGISLVSHAAPSGIEGTGWVVKKAEINTESQRTLRYQYNDDRLVGRTIHFNKENITSTLSEASYCTQPEYSESNLTIDDFIKNTMGEADAANAKNYDLDIKGNEVVSVLMPICHKGIFGGADTGENSKIALSGNKMFVNWYDGAILVLAPLDSKEKPAPSYSCIKAQSYSEKAICSDYDLSSYDKSINNAWKKAVGLANSTDNKELKDKILLTQKQWLVKRNSCKEDKSCLKKSMVDRLEEIADFSNQ